ncbi:sulfurtransferase TusA [Litoribrevibacter euphylliae]|uniref:Sulfurtransferase TusA n=1 Tax=Litoribrevibacter euphylliae TaxID=1834034 RepID=A0ABV7HEK4_9GAMM
MTESNYPEFQHELDAKGLMCPEPVMLLHKKVRAMASGEVLRIEATDPSTTRDIPQFCNMLDHTLLKEEVLKQDGSEIYLYFIQRR